MFRNDERLAGALRQTSLRRTKRLQRKTVLPRLRGQDQLRQVSSIKKQTITPRWQGEGQVSAQPASGIGAWAREQKIGRAHV